MLRILLAAMLYGALAGCTVTPTHAPEGDLDYRVTALGDLEVLSRTVILEGAIDVFGRDLVVDSELCFETCEPNAEGFIDFQLPPIKGGNYTRSVVIDVVQGTPVAGQATVWVSDGTDGRRLIFQSLRR